MMPTINTPSTQKSQNFRDLKMQRSIDTEVLEKVTGLAPSSVKYVDVNQHNKMGKDEFLKLLSFQLQNQDPMSPMDQNKFAGDLAQFSQLEQLANMNKTLEAGQKGAPDQHKFYAASFIGKNVTTSGTSLNVVEGSNSVEVPFKLDRPARNMVIRILDKKGQMVGQIERENLPAGTQSLSWNKKMLDGQTVAPGGYQLDIYAWDDAMQMFKGETQASGTIKAVSFENGETVFTLNDDKRVFLRDVDTFAALSDNSQEKMKKAIPPANNIGFEAMDPAAANNAVNAAAAYQKQQDATL